MKPRIVVILAIVVLAIVGVAIWFLQMPVDPNTLAVPTPSPTEATPSGTRPGGTPAPAVATPPKVASLPKSPTLPASTPRQLAEWEARIDQVLRMNASETE